MMQLYPSNHGHKKNEQVIHALKKLLPSRETLYKVLDGTKDWWKNITLCMVGPGGTPANMTDIHAYAEFALTVGSPMDVAKILHMVLSHSNLQDHQIEAILDRIDHLIIQDDEYMGTLSGVEVAHWQARHYGDIGQSRRAWLIIRRAVSFAQLMGLNRTRVNVRQDLAFWGLYQFDRYCSLILGVPYALADVHCNLTFKSKDFPIIFENHSFLTLLATLAGKVIDRTHGPPTGDKHGSLESLYAIDKELTDLKAKMPATYFDLAPVAPRDFQGSAEWMQRSLSMIMFNQTRLILHLPYLFRSNNSSINNPENHDISITPSQAEWSRNICLELSRSTLATFQIARASTNAFVYKTIAIDYLGVIAAVVLVIDIINQRTLQSQSIGAQNICHDEKEKTSDWDLVQMALDTYHQAEELPFGKIATQARKVLAQLLNFRDPRMDHSEPSKILIPFFGTITINSGEIQENFVPSAGGRADVTAASLPNSNSPQESGQSATSVYAASNPALNMVSSSYGSNLRSPTSAANSNMTPILPTQGMSSSNRSPLHPTPPHFSVNHVLEPQISYDGVYMLYDNPDFITSGPRGISSKVPSQGFGGAWQNVGTFDLDQDWTWMMNETTPTQM
jgi:hypothetical protein